MTMPIKDEDPPITTKELRDLRAQVAAALKQKQEALRDWVPPPYFIQSEINAERDYMRREIAAIAAYEREMEGVAKSAARRRLLGALDRPFRKREPANTQSLAYSGQIGHSRFMKHELRLAICQHSLGLP
jgi:hypothetical protein